MSAILKALTQVGTSTWKAFGKAMGNTADAAKETKKAGGGRGAGAGGFGDIVGLFLEPLLRPLIKIFKPFTIVFDLFAAGLQRELLPIVQRIFDLLTDPIIVEAIQEIGRLVGTLFLPLLSTIESFLTSIINNPDVLDDFMDGLRVVFDFFRAIGEVLTQAAAAVFKAIFQFFINNPGIIESLLSGLKTLTEFILQLINLIEPVLTALGAFGYEVGSIAEDVGGFGYDVGQFFGQVGYNIGALFSGQPMQSFARGGIVRGPTSAIIGEAGPEAVIPLDEFPERMEEFGLERNGKSITVVVNGVTDIPRLARMIRDEVEFL
jgi:hypothetical protein